MFSLFFLIYFVALIFSIFTYKKFFDTPLRFFPLLIAYTFFNELLGYFVRNYEEFSFFDEERYNWHNVIIYNIYNLVFYSYLLWLYFQLLKAKKTRKLIKIFALILALAYVVSLFFQDPFHSGLYFANCLACIFTAILILLHFRQLKQLNKNQPSKFNTMVWFGSGMLLFVLYYPIFILNGYHNVEFFLEFKLRQILWGVITVMYTLFIIGFVMGQRRYFC